MCPGIGTGRDPSSPNYPHSRRPCGTLCLNIYICGCSHTHGCSAHTTHYMSLPVVYDISEQFYAPWHHLEEQTWRKIKAYLTIMMMGKSAEQSAPHKSLISRAETADNADLSSSRKIFCMLHQSTDGGRRNSAKFLSTSASFSDNSAHT